MAASLVSVSRDYLSTLTGELAKGASRDNLQFTWSEAWAKDNHYTLFRYEDLSAWVTFTCVFIALITLDNVIMNRYPRCLTVATAAVYTFFWICCAFGFCGWVYLTRGQSQAFMWMSGYMLEWMLSFDNLFVFHMIFQAYGTPDNLKHRPLYLGICGAIIFRLAFIFAGEYLMHAMFFMHFVFGAFLIYTGIKTATVDEDDDDPSQHPLVQWLQARMPFVSAYDSQGRFFIEVEVGEDGTVTLPEGTEAASTRSEQNVLSAAAGNAASYGAAEAGAAGEAAVQQPKKQLRATMLFLVLICLEVSDLLFAVDSVSAIVAQVNDLFLAYTSAVFAMLGLRAMFFIIDELAKIFSLLKYGVAAVLVFIGLKLIAARFYHVPPSVVCTVLVSSITLSMIASVVQDKLYGGEEDEEDVMADIRKLGKVLTPLQSPHLAALKPRAA